MNRSDVIRLANEANIHVYEGNTFADDMYINCLYRFAELVQTHIAQELQNHITEKLNQHMYEDGSNPNYWAFNSAVNMAKVITKTAAKEYIIEKQAK